MRIKQIFLFLLTVCIFVAVGYGAWKVGGFFLQQLTQINPAVVASIIGAMATVFAGIAAVIITQKQTKAREIAESHRGKKVEMYDKYLISVTRLIKSLNEIEAIKAEGISETELITSMFEFKRAINPLGITKGHKSSTGV